MKPIRIKQWMLDSILAHPGRVLAAFLLMIAAAVLLTGRLQFEQDIFEILPRHQRGFSILLHALKTSSAQNKLLVLVSGPRDDQLLEAGRRVAVRLRQLKLSGHPVFEEVTFRKAEAVSGDTLAALLKRFFREPERFLVPDDIPVLKNFLSSPEALSAAVQKSLALLAAPVATPYARLAALDPLNLRRFMLAKLQYLHQGMTFAPGPDMLSPDGRILLIMATPRQTNLDSAATRQVMADLTRLKKDLAPLSIGLTGGFALQAQQQALVKGDILICLIGSVLAVSALFYFVYRSWAVLGLVLLPLAVGLQLALGALSLAMDRIHLLAMAFSAVILGLGIDFAIHVYDRFLMESNAGRSVSEAVQRAVGPTGTAVTAGCLTTLTAFLVLTLTGSPLLVQIGWLVALGLFFCLVSILWALPAGLVWRARHRTSAAPGRVYFMSMDRIGGWVSRRPRTAAAVSLLVLLASVPGIARLEFQKDPLALTPRNLDAVTVQNRLFEAFGSGRQYVLVGWRAAVLPRLWSQSRELDRYLADAKRSGRIEAWVSPSRIATPQPVRIQGIRLDAIEAQLNTYGLELAMFAETRAFLTRLSLPPGRGPAPDLGVCNPSSAPNDVLNRFLICDDRSPQAIAWILTPDGVAADRLQQDLARRFPGMVTAGPRWAMRELAGGLRHQFWETVTGAVLLILVILFLFVGRFFDVLTVLMPVALGCLTTAGWMGWLGVELNLFNFIVIPLLLGIGLDDGIHIFKRYQEKRSVRETVATTGRSILMTTLTTALGFGSLSLAGYHVLQHMGQTAVLGIAACFFYSIVTLPALLQWRQCGRKAAPADEKGTV